MSRVIFSASKYVQGPGAIHEVGVQASSLGGKAFAIGGKTALSRVRQSIKAAFSNYDIEYCEEVFTGISSQKEIQRLAALCHKFGADLVLAIGGGAAIDAGKAVSHEADLPVVVIPTTAATDAPCTALCVAYTEEGVFERYIHLKRNPDCVIMDTEIIATAPARFLIAGMGDAVAAFWETQTCAKSGKLNAFSGASTPSLTVQEISRLCYTTLLDYGLLALKAVEKQIVTPALEAIVEANTLMSGIAAENGGHAAAHAIHNGLTSLEATQQKLHGEKVAFGLLAQLVMEGHPLKKFKEVQTFCYQVGLPITLEGLDLHHVCKDDIRQVAQRSVAAEGTIHATGFAVTAKQIEASIWFADELGREYIRSQGSPHNS